jgi:hypothetical protein
MKHQSIAELLPDHLRSTSLSIENAIVGSRSTQTRFSTPHMVDVLEWWNSGMPQNLVPVATERNDEFIDYYCLNLGEGSPVVAFCDHAIVDCWDSIDAFLVWLKDQL